ncbi:MAG TPA: hypothetical protein VF439_00225 [Candidatus Paceibacterota bacterium]
MKTPDLDRERSERQLTSGVFLRAYNENLPAGFPQASAAYMKEFRKAYPSLFKQENAWSLDQHRKKLMDWLPLHIRIAAEPSTK